MKFIKGLCTLTLISSASCSEDEHSSTVKLGFKKQYGRNFHGVPNDKRRANDEDEIPLENVQNTFYSVDIALGTPGQNISVTLDTGSSDLWVTGPGGLQCYSDSSSDPEFSHRDFNNHNHLSDKTLLYSGSQNSSLGPTGTFALNPSLTNGNAGSTSSADCNLTAVFNPGKSETLQKNLTDPYYIEYEDGTYASGYWVTDNLSVGQLKVHNMSFAIANQTDIPTPVFGIGFVGDETSYWGAAHPYEYANFPQLLKNQGIIQRVAYSLYLNSPKAKEGNILFGGVDKSQYQGQLYSFPILTPNDLGEEGLPYHRLAVTLDNISVVIDGSRQILNTTRIPVVLDSGTTDIYLPSKIADSIASKFNGSWIPDDTGYLIDCPSSKDKINFGFGPLTIETDIGNYISQEGDHCILNIFPSDTILCVLGDVFLVDAYVVYDLEGKQIALAQASFDSSKEDIEPITSSNIPGAKQGYEDSASYKYDS